MAVQGSRAVVNGVAALALGTPDSRACGWPLQPQKVNHASQARKEGGAQPVAHAEAK